MSERILRASTSLEYWFDEGCFISEWSNTPADPELSVARARVPTGGTTRWHCLVGITERYVVLAGRGRIELGDADGGGQPEATARAVDTTELGPGDVAIIAAGVAQRITNVGSDDLVFLALCTPRFRPAAYRDLERNLEPGEGR